MRPRRPPSRSRRGPAGPPLAGPSLDLITHTPITMENFLRVSLGDEILLRITFQTYNFNITVSLQLRASNLAAIRIIISSSMSVAW